MNIVILHGWNLSGSKFAPLAKYLQRRKFRVFTPDLPGFGKNLPVKRILTLNDYAQYVVDFLKGKKIKEAVIIGHSFGGRIGIVLAANYPSYLKVLVLTGTPGLPLSSPKKTQFYLVLAKIGRLLFSFPILSAYQDLARKFLYKSVGSWDYYHTSGAMRETFKKIIAYNLEPHLSQIKIPTLLVWGKKDRVVPEKIGERMAKMIPKAEWVSVPNADHRLPYQEADKFAEKVVDFLRKVSLK